MRLVIEIDENIYTMLHDYGVPPGDWIKIGKAIRKGKPLPKGHGDLIDVNINASEYIAVWECNCSECGTQTVMAIDDLKYLPTIIEADKEENNGCNY